MWSSPRSTGPRRMASTGPGCAPRAAGWTASRSTAVRAAPPRPRAAMCPTSPPRPRPRRSPISRASSRASAPCCPRRSAASWTGASRVRGRRPPSDRCTTTPRRGLIALTELMAAYWERGSPLVAGDPDGAGGRHPPPGGPPDARAGRARSSPACIPQVRWDGRALGSRPPGTTRRSSSQAAGCCSSRPASPGPTSLAMTHAPWQPALIYTPVGIGELWAPSPPPDPAALAALLGRRRAAVLVALARPQGTGSLAAALALPASSVSEHVGILRRAGLACSVRDGRAIRTSARLREMPWRSADPRTARAGPRDVDGARRRRGLRRRAAGAGSAPRAAGSAARAARGPPARRSAGSGSTNAGGCAGAPSASSSGSRAKSCPQHLDVARRVERRRRMEERVQPHRARPDHPHLRPAVQPRDPGRVAAQQLRREVAQRADDLRLDQLELAEQVLLAVLDLDRAAGRGCRAAGT